MATSTSVFLNVKGERGATGPQGPQGPAGPGIAIGGTAGQVLKKRSNSDYDTQWGEVLFGDVAENPFAIIDGYVCQVVEE